jgi:hypothetical protein
MDSHFVIIFKYVGQSYPTTLLDVRRCRAGEALRWQRWWGDCQPSQWSSARYDLQQSGPRFASSTSTRNNHLRYFISPRQTVTAAFLLPISLRAGVEGESPSSIGGREFRLFLARGNGLSEMPTRSS